MAQNVLVKAPAQKNHPAKVSKQAAPAQKNQPLNPGVSLGIIILFVVGVALAGIFIPTTMRLGDWLAILVLLVSILFVLGRSITGYWTGFLIDNRNKMSLARLQLGLWLVLISSAYLAAVLTNLKIGMSGAIPHFSVTSAPSNPLTITIPPEILTIFGVSATSLAGASVVLNVKKNNGHAIQTHGSPKEAHWYDMFKGDDVANSAYLDLSKLQMFYFTIVLVLVYGVSLGILFFDTSGGVNSQPPPIALLPPLSATMVTLLGISQGGYLAYKSIPRKEDQQAKQKAAPAKPEDTPTKPGDASSKPEHVDAKPEDASSKPEDTPTKPLVATAQQ